MTEAAAAAVHAYFADRRTLPPEPTMSAEATEPSAEGRTAEDRTARHS